MTKEYFSIKLGVAALALGMIAASGCGDKAADPGTTTTTTTGTTATNTDKPAGDAAATERKAPPVDGPKVADGEDIKISAIGSLTGDQKPWGTDSLDGANMALEDFNKQGGIPGHKIVILPGDSASKPEQAQTAAEKAIADGAIAIVGEVASGHTIQIAKSAFPKGIPVVAVGATKTTLTNEGTNVFRVCYTDDVQGPVMAKFAYDKLGLRKMALMTDNKQPYSQGLSASFAAAFKKFSLNQSVLHLQEGEAVPQMLPPALAETIPNLPAIKKGHTVAVICSGFGCKPPISEPAELEKALEP